RPGGSERDRPRVRRLPHRQRGGSRRGRDVSPFRSGHAALSGRRPGGNVDDRRWRSPRQLRAARAVLMHAIELTEEELRLIHAALHSYLDDFGHEEADVLRAIKALIAKLPSD